MQAIDNRDKIKGIMSLYCFVCFAEANVVYGRFASCACSYCRTGDKDMMIKQCINQSTVGVLTKYVLKSNKGPIDRQPPRKRHKTT